jgi:RimK family alpha-L-glutamate ligase
MPHPQAERDDALEMTLAVVAHQREPTNAMLAAQLDAQLLAPQTALARLRPGDVALVRLDVRRTLDGCEPGLDLLEPLERRGVEVLNRAPALLAAHDKLRTSRVLPAAGLAHPHTEHITSVHELLEVEPPVVVKPRFGSWGRDVVRCRDRAELEAWAVQLQRRPWFRRTGAIVQELLPPPGHDLRVLVARGRVFGCVERVAKPGEWRTNISLGGTRRRADPSEEACELALAAAAAVLIDVAGVDLLPVDGSYVALELNGAADFDGGYSFRGRDVFVELHAALDSVLPAAV